MSASMRAPRPVKMRFMIGVQQRTARAEGAMQRRAERLDRAQIALPDPDLQRNVGGDEAGGNPAERTRTDAAGSEQRL